MKILVVDDDPGIRANMKRVATHSAPDVFDAENGLEALAVLEREDPDLLITDLHMPLLDGFELVAAVRGSPTHRNMPVICVSIINQREDIERLSALGISDYLLKPVNPVQLDERIRRVLHKASNWRARRGPSGHSDKMPRVLIIDPDPNYRAFVRPLLEPDYEVLEASGGPEGLAIFKELETKPDAVFVSEHIPLLSAATTADVLDRLCAERGVPIPPIILLADSADGGRSHAGFSAVIRRSFIPENFNAAARAWLPKHSPADRLHELVVSGSAVWLLSAARQTIGVLSGQDADPIADDTHVVDHGWVTGSIEIDVAETSGRLHVVVACSAESATHFARSVLHRTVTLETGGADILGEFVNTIGGRVKATLIEKGFTLKLGLPQITTTPVEHRTPHFDVASRVRTTGGQEFFVGVTLIENVSRSDEPASSVGTEQTAAAAPASSDADVEAVLF